MLQAISATLSCESSGYESALGASGIACASLFTRERRCSGGKDVNWRCDWGEHWAWAPQREVMMTQDAHAFRVWLEHPERALLRQTWKRLSAEALIAALLPK